jgi:hypothetical protein
VEKRLFVIHRRAGVPRLIRLICASSVGVPAARGDDVVFICLPGGVVNALQSGRSGNCSDGNLQACMHRLR